MIFTPIELIIGNGLWKMVVWSPVLMAKGTPKRDGSGAGCRANRGRGGCSSTRSKGRGTNRR